MKLENMLKQIVIGGAFIGATIFGGCSDDPTVRSGTSSIGLEQTTAYQSNNNPAGLQEVKADRKKQQAPVEPDLQPTFNNTDIKKIQGHYVNEVIDGNLQVFYTTNSQMMFWNDLEDTKNFVGSLKPGTPIVIEGYADHRGSIHDNLELSKKRAEGVLSTLPTRFRNKHTFEIAAYGESKATEQGHSGRELYKDRKVRLAPGKSSVSRGLDHLNADHYLLDCSGSMNYTLGSGKSRWSAVQDHTFSEDSQVYVFNHCAGPDTPITQISARGGTPLYAGMESLIKHAKVGQTIGVLSDGVDSETSHNLTTLIDSAKDKEIKIGVLGVGLKGLYKNTMQKIAEDTGGKFYFVE
jgi:outer membrane protein OmpA-like peptidoglycan-associated protein